MQEKILNLLRRIASRTQSGKAWSSGNYRYAGKQGWVDDLDTPIDEFQRSVMLKYAPHKVKEEAVRAFKGKGQGLQALLESLGTGAVTSGLSAVDDAMQLEDVDWERAAATGMLGSILGTAPGLRRGFKAGDARLAKNLNFGKRTAGAGFYAGEDTEKHLGRLLKRFKSFSSTPMDVEKDGLLNALKGKWLQGRGLVNQYGKVSKHDDNLHMLYLDPDRGGLMGANKILDEFIADFGGKQFHAGPVLQPELAAVLKDRNSTLNKVLKRKGFTRVHGTAGKTRKVSDEVVDMFNDTAKYKDKATGKDAYDLEFLKALLEDYRGNPKTRNPPAYKGAPKKPMFSGNERGAPYDTVDDYIFTDRDHVRRTKERNKVKFRPVTPEGGTPSSAFTPEQHATMRAGGIGNARQYRDFLDAAIRQVHLAKQHASLAGKPVKNHYFDSAVPVRNFDIRL